MGPRLLTRLTESLYSALGQEGICIADQVFEVGQSQTAFDRVRPQIVVTFDDRDLTGCGRVQQHTWCDKQIGLYVARTNLDQCFFLQPTQSERQKHRCGPGRLAPFSPGRARRSLSVVPPRFRRSRKRR